MQHDDALLAYRLGAIRSGLRATALALALLVLFRLLPGHGSVENWAYVAVLVLATVGAGIVALLPWERMFRAGLGFPGLYTWSVLDIALITFAVGVSGGGHSDLYLLYFLTTIFFGAGYPRGGQVVLLILTVAAYLGVLGLTGWEIGAGLIALRCGAIAIVAFLTSFLSGELLRLVESLQREGRRAERSATLLSTVARSARRLTLDRELVLEGLIDSVVRLGFEGAGLCLFDHEGGVYAVAHHRGLPDAYVNAIHDHSHGMPGRVRASGRTEIAVAEEPAGAGSTPAREPVGPMIGSPVFVDGFLSGVLLGSSHHGPVTALEAEAFELLAAQTGLAIENGQRFEDMLHTVERLEELDRLKDDFLATASHELRTPLTVVLGAGLTLEQQWNHLDESIRREMIENINRNARTLDGLISSLLDFSRLGADSERLAMRTCRLDDLVHASARRLSLLFADRPLEVDAEKGLIALADPVLLERVLENLLANASKHTPVGTHVRLAARTEDHAAVVSVADDGPGVSDEDARHLGERFFRGGAVNSRARGLGLGLALIREILELHGTELEIETGLGTGSSFTFRLPLAETEEPYQAHVSVRATPTIG